MKKRTGIRILEFSVLVIGAVLVVWFVNQVGIEQIRANVNQFGIWAPLVVLLLRLTSIVIPALPGTAYSILAGTLFGFVNGLIVIAIADLIACTVNFFIAKRYGRELVETLVGQRFIGKIDHLSHTYLEGNFFLFTGVLMTGVFDFVCYAVGLTQMSWRSFMTALSLSIVVAKPPLVALGAGLFEGGRVLLGVALLGTFVLAIITGWLKRRRALEQQREDE
ncbi:MULTISPECIES: VTT domain-containing protein [unclassified Leptolyngbya]|uniref:TVP38/TMEM64 family protein n=1 Tax=unclassified Leptolyngbya TaxID=2650499 RepID=UPI0016863506|nr:MULTISPECIES: VTT domain-containing protein [unclassified Leptolyngbya]MBD1913467.1 TVP38/TMEM64 family protein [Leptolyngbya sp. FACHB-8]MBD2156330.1 TVP38/TMEM64 family protein [Leptolyngbya sp. FACHB-16]